MNNRSNPEDALFCRQDSHWSGAGCVLAATEIGRELLATFKDRPKQAFTGQWDTVGISGDLWQALGDPKPPREQVRIRRVSRTGRCGALESDPNSPVILLGDSHGLIFHSGDDMLAREAGLSDQLALELGFPVDLVAVRGSGATPARINLLRRAQKDPNYWAGKKWVVWCFSAREFTESDGWRKVPVKP
jgi:alginate O-acetyltransferase complex protein AlgJ